MSGRRDGMNTGIQTYRRSDGYWVARIEAGWTPRGTRLRPSAVARTEAEAKRRARELLRKYREGGQQALAGRNVTVAAWAARWEKIHFGSLKPRVREDYESKLRLWIIPTIGRRKLSELNPGDIRRVADAIAQARLSTTSAKNAHRVLKNMLRAAKREGLYVPDAALLTQSPKAAKSTRTAIAPEELAAILEVVQAQPDRSRWLTALSYGLRQGETLGLTWGCVDLEHGHLRIDWELQRIKYADRKAGTFDIPDHVRARQLYGGLHLMEVKTDATERELPLIDDLADELRAWRKIAPSSPHDLVWPRDNGHPRNSIYDRREWYEIQARAGVVSPDGDPYELHEIRHTVVSVLDALKVPEATRIAIVGHASAGSSQPYLHTSDPQMVAALEAAATTLGLGKKSCHGKAQAS